MAHALASKALLATFKARAWKAKVVDYKAMQQITSATNAANDVFTVTKSLLGKGSPLALCHSVKDAAGREHRSMTLPWTDKGPRILPVTKYLDHGKMLQQAQADFWASVDVFEPQYPDLRDAQKSRQGSAWNPLDWPDPSTLREFFKWEVRLDAIAPATTHFLIDVGAAEVAAIEAGLEAREKDLQSKAQAAAWGKLDKALRHMTERLSKHGVDEDGYKTGIFRDSLVDGFKKVLDVLPHFNLMDDPQFGSILDECRSKLIVASAADLRELPQVRERVSVDAHKIQSDVSKVIAKMASIGYAAPEDED